MPSKTTLEPTENVKKVLLTMRDNPGITLGLHLALNKLYDKADVNLTAVEKDSILAELGKTLIEIEAPVKPTP